MKYCVLSHRGFSTFPRASKQIESLASQEGVDVVVIGIQMLNGESETFNIGNATVKHLSLPISLPMVGPLKIVNTIIAMMTLLFAAWEERADVYHCFNIYALIVGSILSTTQSSQLTYDASEPNGLQIRIQFPGILGKLMSGIVNRIEGILAARTVAVFTVNSSDGVPFDRLTRYNSNTVILENVPQLSEFDANPEDSPLDPETKTLIYVGGVSERKGGDIMIEAMVHVVEDHPDAQLVIIGGGTDSYMCHLRDRIETLGIEDNVWLLGPVEYDRVPAYLADATVGYQLYQPGPWTSRSKASSTVFRHMGAELPVVVTDLPGLGELIEDLECGLTVPVDDPESIGAAVSGLLADEEQIETLAANGRRQVETRYNWKIEEERFLDHMPVPQTADTE